ncbi:hypothetical protein A3Q56_02662 [Intoshia linei]|uniref:DDE-1 domain-containing protein n=1 Tax=Intoshia linei TaxID=1819745 RepID=A0A177B5H4_9BILA|nr:hypothetical protein A3Q56_02662 [Intoshia linei]
MDFENMNESNFVTPRQLAIEKRKILLFVDNYTAHVMRNDLPFIKLAFLPKNTTSKERIPFGDITSIQNSRTKINTTGPIKPTLKDKKVKPTLKCPTCNNTSEISDITSEQFYKRKCQQLKKALEETLYENEKLLMETQILEEENKMYKSMSDNAEYFANILSALSKEDIYADSDE